MYAANPPRRGGADGVLALTAVRSTVFDRPAGLSGDADHLARLTVYLRDLLGQYGERLAPGALDSGAGQSYGEMAGRLLESRPAGTTPVDLLVVAFAVPDITPGRATATYLSHLCPGNRMAFAVCDQGPAAAFTALRLIHGYTASGDSQRSLLLILEQADLPYDVPDPHTVPARHAAVALWCDATNAGGTLSGGTPDARAAPRARVRALRQHPGVLPDRVAARLAPDLAEFTAGHPDAMLVAGRALATALDAAPPGVSPGTVRIRAADDGQPTTGVWTALAAELARETSGPAGAEAIDGAVGPAGAARTRRVLVADYDPVLHYLSLSAMDVGTTTRPDCRVTTVDRTLVGATGSNGPTVGPSLY